MTRKELRRRIRELKKERNAKIRELRKEYKQKISELKEEARKQREQEIAGMLEAEIKNLEAAIAAV